MTTRRLSASGHCVVNVLADDRLASVHHYITLKIVRTTVTLDDDVYEAAMHLSRSSGERLGKVLSALHVARSIRRVRSRAVQHGDSRCLTSRIMLQ